MLLTCDLVLYLVEFAICENVQQLLHDQMQRKARIGLESILAFSSARTSVNTKTTQINTTQGPTSPYVNPP